MEGKAADALSKYKECLSIAMQEATDGVHQLRLGKLALGGCVGAYASLGQDDEAAQSLAQAEACDERLKVIQPVQPLPFYGRASDNFGQPFHKGVEHHEQALLISKAIADQAGQAGDLRGLGVALTSLGRYEDAMEKILLSLDVSRNVQNDQAGEVASLISLGHVHICMGQYKAALVHLTQAVETSTKIGDERAEGNALLHLGSAHAALGQLDAALDAHSRALRKIVATGDDREQGHAKLRLGTTYASLDQVEKAIGLQEEALSLLRTAGDRWGEGICLRHLGSSQIRAGDSTAAVSTLANARRVLDEIGDTQGSGEASTEMGLAYRNTGHLSLAADHLKAALRKFDAVWSDLSADQARVAHYDIDETVKCSRLLQNVLICLGLPDAALEAAEAARSRSLEMVLAKQQEVRGRWIGSGGTMMFQEAAPMYGPARSQAVSVHDMQAVAERQQCTIVVFSHVDQTQLLAWVMRSGGAQPLMKRIDVVSEDTSLTSLIEVTRRAIGARARQGDAASEKAIVRQIQLLDDDDDDATDADGAGGAVADAKTARRTSSLDGLLQRCHEILITPLGLADGESLLLLPDRDLYALPFAAMLDANGKYLIERHSLRVAASVGTVIELEKRAVRRAAASGTALVVGNPSFHGWASQLPGAENEAQRVSGVLTASAGYKDGVSTMVGAAATKEEVVGAMRDCDVIHLATHGTADGVLLGGASKADGKLSMGEVQGLKLTARLVVLSECDSFRGQLTADGVIGITRAFVAAGAPTLVASLWKVDDIATRVLMERFYERVLKDADAAGDAAAAMQGAMISMIRDDQWSVLQWAAFVVYGLAVLPPRVIDDSIHAVAAPEGFPAASTVSTSMLITPGVFS